MKSVYQDLKFPSHKNRPFFYANFVMTLDGKVQVLKNTEKYWPLGSATDYATLVDLRTYADVLIHGKTTALAHPTIESINKPEFRRARKKRDKSETLPYIIVSNHPGKELTEKYEAAPQKPILITNSVIARREERATKQSRLLREFFNLIPCGKTSVNLTRLSQWLFTQGYKRVLVEGGPHLFGAFLEANLIDELFLTIAPKIIGNEVGKTLTLVKGILFNPKLVKKWHLISVKSFEDELFLRYQRTH